MAETKTKLKKSQFVITSGDASTILYPNVQRHCEPCNCRGYKPCRLASISTSKYFSVFATKAFKMFSKTSSAHHFRNLWYEDNIHKMALKTVNGFNAGRPVDLRAGNSGSIISCCALAVAFVVKWVWHKHFPLADFSNSFYQRICLCFIFALYQHALVTANRRT